MSEERLREWELVPYNPNSELPPDPWLVISPHPDDETIGMGGTIARACEIGAKVYVWEVTSGDLGGEPSIREAEAVRAMEILGVDPLNLFFSRIGEKELRDSYTLFCEDMVSAIEKVEPRTIFIPSPVEFHDCHRTVTSFSIRWILNHMSELEEDLTVSFYEITRQGEINSLVCIDRHFLKKLSAIRAYGSQDTKRYIRIAISLNRLRAYTTESCRLCEGFFTVPKEEVLRIFSHLHAYDEFSQATLVLSLERRIRDLNDQLQNLRAEMQRRLQEAQQRETHLIGEVNKLNAELERSQTEIRRLEDEKRLLTNKLEEIEASILWKLCRKYYAATEKLFPMGSKRRNAYNVVKKAIVRSATLRHPVAYIKGKLLDRLKSSLVEAPFSFPVEDVQTVKGINSVHGVVEEKVSVVSVLYNNSAEELASLIESLRIFKHNVGEIILIDNSEAPVPVPSVEWTKIHYVKSPCNVGFGAAVNTGVKQAVYPFILVINPDACLQDNSLTEMLKHMLSDEQVAVVEAFQIPWEHPKMYNPVNLEPVWASGSCFLIRKEAFLKVGGFDEHIFLYGEDVDLSWRLKDKGYRIIYVPTARVHHDIYRHRDHMDRYAQASNLYLRIKYKAPIFPWILLSLGKGRVHSPPLKTIISALKHRHNSTNCYFDTTSFGYEIFRRRDEGVAVPEKLPYTPLVTIIVRTHKRGALLRRALTTIANQTYPLIEVVVVEDRSKEAPDVIKVFPFLNIKYFYTTSGRTRALNIGLEVASGEFIMFLDDDDMLFADAVELLVGYAVKEEFEFVYGGSIIFETDNKIDGYLKPGYFEKFDRDRLMVENYIPMGSFVISRKLVEKTGVFDEELEYLEDWDFIRRAASVTDFLFVPKDLLIFCVPRDKARFMERQHLLDKAYKKVVSKRLS